VANEGGYPRVASRPARALITAIDDGGVSTGYGRAVEA
jgi:hypothetical protein